MRGIRLVLVACIAAVGLGGSCARWKVSELHTICVRYVDEAGYLRGRTATFNDEGARKVLRRHRFSHEGVCDANAQGPALRAQVCLPRSSRCGHDRTAEIWGDQFVYYERSRGATAGACTTECSQHRDECFAAMDKVRRGFPPKCYGTFNEPIYDSKLCPDPFTIPNDGETILEQPPPEKD